MQGRPGVTCLDGDGVWIGKFEKRLRPGLESAQRLRHAKPLDLYSLSLFCLAVKPCHRSPRGLPYPKESLCGAAFETALITNRLSSRPVGGSPSYVCCRLDLPATASPFLNGRLRLVAHTDRAQEWGVLLLAIPLPRRRRYGNPRTWAGLMAAVTLRFVSGARPTRFCVQPSRGCLVWCHVRRLRHQSAV